jgi:dipeptidyl aminopeptidase/acylaminoacyl peptidase
MRLCILAWLMVLIPGTMPFSRAGPPNECIYFTRHGDIWVMEPDGSNPRPITKTVVREEFPVCSPDGRWLVYQIYDAGRLQYDLRLMRSDGSQDRTLVGRARHPAWSPTGEWVAYDSLQEDGSLDIWVIRPDGSGKRRWTDHPDLEMFPAWSPWGEALAFVRTHPIKDREGRVTDVVSQIVVRDWTGRERTVFSQAQGQIVSLAWSSRDELAFCLRSLGSDRTQQIWRIRLDGTGLQRLSPEGTGLESAPSWSPDGEFLAFVRFTPEGGQIWRMRADGMGRVPLTSSSSDDQTPHWFPGVKRRPIQVWQGQRRFYWLPLPVVKEGEVWVPIRELARTWNWEIERSPQGEIRLKHRGYPFLTLRPQQRQMRVDHRTLALPSPPFRLHDHWMVPFLTLAKEMGWAVVWDEERRVLRIPEKLD